MNDENNVSTTTQQPFMPPPVPPVVPSPSVVASAPQNPAPKRFSKKIWVVIGLSIFLLLCVGLGAYIMHSKKPVNTTQAPPDVLLATVGTQKIYKSTVEKIAEEQVAKNAITNDVLKNFYNTAIERAILDIEAQKEGIVITDQEVAVYAKDRKFSQQNFNNAKYQLLKQKITLNQIKNVQAYSIGFWVPPYTWQQKPTDAVVRSTGLIALSDAQDQLSKNAIPLDVVKNIYNKYPVLQSIISLNGYKYSPQLQEPYISYFLKPATFIFDPKAIVSYPDLYNALSSMQENQIALEIQKDGGGGNVLKVISINKSGFTSYADFLNQRKQQLVKVYSSL